MDTIVLKLFPELNFFLGKFPGPLSLHPVFKTSPFNKNKKNSPNKKQKAKTNKKKTMLVSVNRFLYKYCIVMFSLYCNKKGMVTIVPAIVTQIGRHYHRFQYKKENRYLPLKIEKLDFGNLPLKIEKLVLNPNGVFSG